MDNPKILWRPCSNADPNEATWRRRGRNIIHRLQDWGIDIQHTFDLGEQCDVFVLQRMGSMAEVQALQMRGVKTIFDINDCHLYAAFHNPEEARLAAAVDYVVTASRHMAHRYSELNPKTVMIQEALENDFFATEVSPPPSPPFVISWHGMDDNLQYVEPILPALERVSRRHPILVKIIMPPLAPQNRSNADRVATYPFPTKFVPWKLESFIQESSTAHIGIAPLHDTEFCRNKGYHKPIGYMALGVPVVAADIAPYREVVEHGKTGFLAGTLKEWEESLNALIESEALRKSIAANARPMAQNFTIDRAAGLWKDFLSMVLGDSNDSRSDR